MNTWKKGDSTTSGKEGRLPIPKWRKWLFRLAALILAPVLVCSVVEGIVRVIGFGYPTGFFLHKKVDGEKRVFENNKFGWRFFGPKLARTPSPLNFPEAKPNGTVRIFIFGESAAYGDPQPDFGLPRMLEVLLQARYPGVRFEVINAAMVAINSHVILPIARDCAKEHGDIWLVYMGNNEVVGPFGCGTVFGAQVPPLPLIRANLTVKTTRTGELLSELMMQAHGGETESADWRGMMMFVKNQVRHDDPRMARVYSHFEKNLTDIIRTGTDCGAKVIVSTVASNLRNCAPFGSQHLLSLTSTQSNEWSRFYKGGIEAEATGNSAAAAACYAQAASLDPHFADLQFRWARTSLALGLESEAREHFVLARNYDTLRFRADSRINEIIRNTAVNRGKEGVAFVDASEELAKQSPHGICGEEFFYEHVHFNFEGNYALARMFADQISRLLPANTRPGADRHQTWISADECASLLGWNDWSKHRVLTSLQINVPPFNFQLNHTEMLQRVHERAEQLAKDLTRTRVNDTAEEYRRLTLAKPGDWVFHKRLAEVLQELDDLSGAAEHWRRVAELIPQSAEAPLQLNLILLNQGDLQKAADEYAKAVKLDRNFTEDAYAKLLNKIGGRVFEKNGAAAAEPFFRQAISLKPYFAEAQISLGTALNALGQTNEAREVFQNALRHPPTTPLGLRSLGQVCHQQGWTNEAIRNLEAAVNLDPTDSAAHFHLGTILFELGKNVLARREFEETLRYNPENAAAQEYLSRISQKDTPAP